MGADTETIRGKNAAEWRKWITAFILLAVFAVVLVFTLGGPSAITRRLQLATGLSNSPHSSPSDALRDPEILVNETVVIPASGHQARAFSLPSDRAIRVEISGVRDTAKGFSVHLINPAQWGNISSGREFRYLRQFEGVKVSSMNDTARLPAGRYMLVISNSENILNSMEVLLKITANPD